jgi:hypothetical protein
MISKTTVCASSSTVTIFFEQRESVGAKAMYCTYCGVSINIQQQAWGSLPQGECGLRYGDGRIICHKCHHTAVKNDSQIKAVCDHVKHCFAELGLTIEWSRLPIRLQHQPQIEQSAGGANVIGYAESTISGTSVSSRVTLLYGMPAALAVETLAHEAGHVWCREHNIQFNLDPNDEEGFCNVLACLALKRLGNQHDANHRINAMFQNNDPIYGDKFRAQWTQMCALGWEIYKRQLVNH